MDTASIRSTAVLRALEVMCLLRGEEADQAAHHVANPHYVDADAQDIEVSVVNGIASVKTDVIDMIVPPLDGTGCFMSLPFHPGHQRLPHHECERYFYSQPDEAAFRRMALCMVPEGYAVFELTMTVDDPNAKIELSAFTFIPQSRERAMEAAYTCYLDPLKTASKQYSGVLQQKLANLPSESKETA